jgi:N4-gp56 family major capsid protein
MSENALTTTSEIDPAVELYYDRSLLLDPLYPEYIYSQFARRFSLARKRGNSINIRRYTRLSAATTPLTEGITPSGSKLAKTDIQAQLSQYGDYVTITDIVDMTVEDPVLNETSKLQNDQVNNTYDQLARDYLCASASSTTCSHGSGTATLLNKTDIDGVVVTLRGNDIKYLFQRVKAGVGQGTSPLRAAYAGLADVDLEDDLEDVSGFKAVTNYASDGSVLASEYGNTNRVRWLTSSGGYVSSSNYYCPILGQEAYGMVDLKGGNAKSIIKGFGSGGVSDPLNQRMTMGWKFMNAVRILQDIRVHVLVCTNG